MLPASTPVPVIHQGRYVRLEPLSLTHAADLFRISQDPDSDRLYRYLPDTVEADQGELTQWITDRMGASDPMFFACVDPVSGRALGRQSLMRITPAHGVIEIGHILWGPAMAGTRLATEALFLMARHLFDELGYRRFEWKCNALNEPSRRAALRFGFSFEGIFRQHMWIKGQNRDTAWYAMIDRDWPRIRSAYDRWLAESNFDSAGRQHASLDARTAAT
jgi:RimJ/RimL family protein N-acetyltransferase